MRTLIMMGVNRLFPQFSYLLPDTKANPEIKLKKKKDGSLLKPSLFSQHNTVLLLLILIYQTSEIPGSCSCIELSQSCIPVLYARGFL